MNINKLKEDVKTAIAIGEQVKNIKDREEQRQKEAQTALIRAQAEQVILDIPKKCQKAASEGANSCKVFEERNYSFHRSTFHSSSHGWTGNEITGGPGIFIIEACKQAGLEVQVLAADDGIGENSWVEIWVSW